MKKILILALALSFVGASAATVGESVVAYTPPTNAYWQIVDDGGDNVLACVLQGQTVYGNGDDSRIYNTATMDFTGVTGDLTLEFDVSLVNDSANDHCVVQIRDAGEGSWTTLEDINADTVGYEHRVYDLINGGWGDWTVFEEVYVRLRWISDGAGTGDGTRINDIGVLEQGNAGIVEDFEDYSAGDDMADIGWTEQVISGTGHWLVDSTLAYGGPPPGTGKFMSCDDDAIDLVYNTYAWSPEVSDIQSTDLTVEFGYNYYGGGADLARFYIDVNGTLTQIAQYPSWTWAAVDVSYDLSSYLAVGDDFKLGWYYYSPMYWMYWFAVDDIYLDIPVFTEIFADDFEGDLSLWTVVDEGSGNLNIEDRSLGTIKGMFH